MTKTCEVSYERRKTAGWLLKVLKTGIHLDHAFFVCLEWCLGDLRGLMKQLAEAANVKFSGTDDEDEREALEILASALRWNEAKLARHFDDVLDDYPCLAEIARGCVAGVCGAVASASSDSRVYARIRNSFRKIFGASRESAILCEFVSFIQTNSILEGFFEDNIGICRISARDAFARMLGISRQALTESIQYLTSFGLLEAGHNCFRLKGGTSSLWEGASPQQTSRLFCAPLTGQTLPLDSFRIPADTLKHVERLLARKDGAQKTPVHIILYGPPGTGKTTFARSLARTLGVKAWSVSSRKDDDDSARRGSLTACLKMSRRHPGSFVLVDEAERLLDTSWQSKDKAWLNSFLEQPDNRVIWITNQIEHIDPAVRRRFSFSVYFGALGKQERRNLWDQIVTRHRVKSCLTESQVEKFAENYRISAAVIEQAVSQAKELGYGRESGGEFESAVERVLHAHSVLANDGAEPGRRRAGPLDEYTLSGVCLDGSVEELMDKCRRADAVYTEAGSLRPGAGSMLFYGPPGTGKTALARHIARELGRESFVKRASDLLSPWVGASEQNVAEAFRCAERAGAVLVVDEADTFLYSRDTAQRSWESSLVNEFLTALEECRGFCICSTNRMEKMDAAAIRRFSFKVGFTYAGPEQISALYAALLSPIAEGKLPRALELELRGMTRLTPGDFHAVRSQHWLARRGEVTHGELVRGLKREQDMKLDKAGRRIGFAVQE